MNYPLEVIISSHNLAVRFLRGYLKTFFKKIRKLNPFNKFAHKDGYKGTIQFLYSEAS